MRRALLACAASVALVGAVACEDLVDPIVGGDPQNLSFAPCVGSSDYPTWFAFQDGDGPWTAVNATSGSFNFTISTGKGGIALHNSGGLLIVYATTDEFKANLPQCGGASVRTVTGSVTGYNSTLDDVALNMGTTGIDVLNAAPATFAIPGVDPGATDFIGVRYRQSTTTGGTFEAFPNMIFMRRNVTGTTTSQVDFASATEADVPLQRTLSVTNLNAGDQLLVYSYLAMTTSLANIARYEAAAAVVPGAATAPFYGVAGVRLVSGETHMLEVDALKSLTSTSEESRFKTVLFSSSPVDQSLTLGPTLGTVTITGTSRPTASYTVQSGYDQLFEAVFTQGNGASFRQIDVVATSGYMGGATAVTLSVPSLSGAIGFSSTWLMTTGTTAFWTFLATSADLSLLNGAPAAYQGAYRTSTFTP